MLLLLVYRSRSTLIDVIGATWPTTRYRYHSMNNSNEPQDQSTTHLLPSTVHAWVVTEWPLLCLHYHPAHNYKGWPNKTPSRRHFKLYRHSSHKSHSSACMDFFVDFGCVLQMIFWKLLKKMLLVLGPRFRDRESLGTTKTRVKSKANRGWPRKLVNHIQPQLNRLCPKPSWTPNLQYTFGAPPYWGFQRFAQTNVTNNVVMAFTFTPGG